MIVLDTHVFLWYALDDARLPAATRDQMSRDPEAVFLPTICLWEMMVLAERGRVSLPGRRRPDVVFRDLLKQSGFSEAPLTTEIALLSRTLAFEHEDPADRFIAATAKHLGFPLATSNRNLRNLGWLRLAY